MNYKITGGKVLLTTADDLRVEAKDIFVRDGRICAVTEPGQKQTAEAAFVNERGATPTPGLPPHYPPQTGDQSHAGFYLLLGITAAMALIAVLFGRRKRKKGA